jgi:predicted O-methyltransferase YrrM
MYSKLTHAKKWLHYYRTASNGVGHGIHSPFVFDFVKNVLNDKREFYAFAPIERLRLVLKNDQSIIQVDDLGAGSSVSKSNQRTISQIARYALKSKKLAQFLFRLVNYYQPENIIELGTSLGVTTAYLGAANPKANVYTIEGAPAIAAIARKNLQALNVHNVKLLEGSFDAVLPVVNSELKRVDFAFVDGNHRLEPTLYYFEQLTRHTTETSILVFDDIHWSAEMELAWKRIQDHPLVMCTVDLFFLGLVFFRKDFKVKQHFTIRF